MPKSSVSFGTVSRNESTTRTFGICSINKLREDRKQKRERENECLHSLSFYRSPSLFFTLFFTLFFFFTLFPSLLTIERFEHFLSQEFLEIVADTSHLLQPLENFQQKGLRRRVMRGSLISSLLFHLGRREVVITLSVEGVFNFGTVRMSIDRIVAREAGRDLI
jgi:hypothetical protein